MRREMSPNESETHSDVWAEWLLRRRHGDDPDFARAIQGRVEHFADRVLDGACLSPGMRVVDVGAGDGLIAFRAIDRIGPSLNVVLSDLSTPLLRHVERLAELGCDGAQGTFICPPGPADAIRDWRAEHTAPLASPRTS